MSLNKLVSELPVRNVCLKDAGSREMGIKKRRDEEMRNRHLICHFDLNLSFFVHLKIIR